MSSLKERFVAAGQRRNWFTDVNKNADFDFVLPKVTLWFVTCFLFISNKYLVVEKARLVDENERNNSTTGQQQQPSKSIAKTTIPAAIVTSPSVSTTAVATLPAPKSTVTTQVERPESPVRVAPKKNVSQKKPFVIESDEEEDESSSLSSLSRGDRYDERFALADSSIDATTTDEKSTHNGQISKNDNVSSLKLPNSCNATIS
jgi:hypothetical protein